MFLIIIILSFLLNNHIRIINHQIINYKYRLMNHNISISQQIELIQQIEQLNIERNIAIIREELE